MMRHLLLLWGLLSLVFSCSAGIVFEETFQKIQAKPDAETVKVLFPFKIEGEQVIEIAEFDAPCSCLSAQVSNHQLIWKPGESGVVETVFKMGNFKGEVDKHILLRLKGEQTPSTKLSVRVNIPTLVEISPKTLVWHQEEELAEKVISITINQEEPIRIVEMIPTNQSFTYQLETVEEGKKYLIKASPKTTEKQCLGVIRLTTDAQIEKHRQYTAFVVVKKKLKK